MKAVRNTHIHTYRELGYMQYMVHRTNQFCCHMTRFSGSKYHANAFVDWAPPLQTLLGSLQRSHRLPVERGCGWGGEGGKKNKGKVEGGKGRGREMK